MFYISEIYDRNISRNSSIRMMIVSDGDRTNRICDSNISNTFIVLQNIVIWKKMCCKTFYVLNLVYD